MKKGIEVKWLVEAKCDRCENEGPVSPVAVTQTLHSSNYDTGFNNLLCANCRMEI
jgi:hypothetical protein